MNHFRLEMRAVRYNQQQLLKPDGCQTTLIPTIFSLKCVHTDLTLPHIDIVFLALPVVLEHGDLGHVPGQFCRLKGQKSRALTEGCRWNTGIAALPPAPGGGGRLPLKCGASF